MGGLGGTTGVMVTRIPWDGNKVVTAVCVYIYICMLVVLMWCKAGALSLFARPNKVVLAAAFAVDVEGLEEE